MKKILVVLLVLAVAGGVFAQQGEWTTSASARVGGEVDFKANPVTVGSTSDDGWNNKGTFDLGYTTDSGLKVSLGFSVQQLGGDDESGGIGATVSYDADRYAFKVSAPVKFLLLNGVGQAEENGDFTGIGGIDALWGYYKLLNGLVHLEAAYKGRGDGWWESDGTYGGGEAKLDGISGILANVDIESLQFGIIVPYLFDKQPAKEFVKEALLESIFGFKFSMAPVEFAAQFMFKNYGVYFGGKWFVVPDVLTVGLNFKGQLKNDGNVGAGASLNYTQDVFGAGVGVLYQIKDPSWLEVKPNFYYKVLPDYFYFGTELTFHFEDKDIQWGITPQIAWNFLGDGAKDFGGLNTGMGLKFDLKSDSKSTLYVGFKWGI